MPSLLVLGVGLAVVSSFVSNFGLNLQKLNHNRNDRSSRGNLRSSLSAPVTKVNYATQPLWLMGLSLVIFGSFLDFSALAFAPQSVVAPLGSLTLVSNTLLAPILLKEKISKRDIGGTLAIVAGSFTAVYFTSPKAKSFTIQELFNLYTRIRFLFYAVFVSSVIAAITAACWWLRKLQKSNAHQYAMKRKQHRFLLSASAGIVGAQSVLFAKSVAELLVTSFKGGRVMFAYWQCYLVLAGLGITIFCQIKWLNTALRLFDALYVVPVFQSFWISFSVISGMVFFEEYQEVFVNLTNSIMFPFGICLTLMGVTVLSGRGTSSSKDGASHAGTRRQSVTSASVAPLLDSVAEEFVVEEEGIRRRSIVNYIGPVSVVFVSEEEIPESPTNLLAAIPEDRVELLKSSGDDVSADSTVDRGGLELVFRESTQPPSKQLPESKNSNRSSNGHEEVEGIPRSATVVGVGADDVQLHTTNAFGFNKGYTAVPAS